MLEVFAVSSIEWWHFPVIFAAGFLGEGYGAIVGGGSIVMISVQSWLGVPLQSAIATDNAAALGTEAGILTETYDSVIENRRLISLLFIPLVLGGIIGTLFLLTISQDVIKNIMIVAVVFLLIYSYFIKDRINPNIVKKWRLPLLFVFMFIIGLYNNFIGVGEGTFSKLALMLILGLTFVESHGLKTVAMVPIRLFSLVVTAFAGLIVWPYLLTFWVATFFAGKYATRLVKIIPSKHLKAGLTLVSVLFIFYLITI